MLRRADWKLTRGEGRFEKGGGPKKPFPSRVKLGETRAAEK